MAGKTTIRAPTNIAFVKYWGARNIGRAVPFHPSISMTLRACRSCCTVEYVDEAGEHEIRWRGSGELATPPAGFISRVRNHLNALRAWAGCGGRFRVAAANNFPAAAGLGSSASGFAALTLATLGAIGRAPSREVCSSLARISGAGSAARSVMGGYVEWPVGTTADAECFARQLFAEDYWDLRDVIAIVDHGPKAVPSRGGHLRVHTSPFFHPRVRHLPKRLATIREAIHARDFPRLGVEIEAEGLDLHCIALSSRPAILYWKPATLTVLETLRHLRDEGLEVYASLDAGANVHAICLPESEDEVAQHLGRLEGIREIIRDGVGSGPAEEEEHLF